MEQNINIQCIDYTLVITLIIVAGVLGGLTNVWRNEDGEKDFHVFMKNILMGVSASLLIPLFLNMISSNLLNEISKDNSSILVFFGFCLIASLSSKAFIQSISDNVLKEVRKTNERVENIEKNVEPIVSKETEESEETEYETKKSFFTSRGFSFDDNGRKVLGSLGASKYAWRTMTGIKKDTGLDNNSISQSLNWLSLNKLAVKANDKERSLWGLTIEGRDILKTISQTTELKKDQVNK